VKRCRKTIRATSSLRFPNALPATGAVQQIVGPERRGACFASSVVRRRLRELAPPGQLRRSVASLQLGQSLFNVLKELSSNQRIAFSTLLALAMIVTFYLFGAVFFNTLELQFFGRAFYWLLYFPRPVFDLFFPASPNQFEPGSSFTSTIASSLTVLLVYSFGIDAIIGLYVRARVKNGAQPNKSGMKDEVKHRGLPARRVE
jgi:hypothetical protein